MAKAGDLRLVDYLFWGARMAIVSCALPACAYKVLLNCLLSDGALSDSVSSSCLLLI